MANVSICNAPSSSSVVRVKFLNVNTIIISTPWSSFQLTYQLYFFYLLSWIQLRVTGIGEVNAFVRNDLVYFSSWMSGVRKWENWLGKCEAWLDSADDSWFKVIYEYHRQDNLPFEENNRIQHVSELEIVSWKWLILY